MMAQTKVLDLEDLPREVRSQTSATPLYAMTLESAEKRAIIHTLATTKNKTLVARTLKISRARLYRLMEHYGLDENSPEKEQSPEAAGE
jgi:transcriptional regulator of acetoin/glycerol metabolism